MTLRTKMMTLFAAGVLGTTGVFAQTSSRGEGEIAVTDLPAGIDTSNQGSAAVAPGTGLPPGISAKRAETADVRSDAISQKPQEHPYSPSSEPSFLSLVR